VKEEDQRAALERVDARRRMALDRPGMGVASAQNKFIARVT
jgi:hypothetical protein